MSADAFQYAPDKRAALAEIARVLRGGGRLVIFTFELDPSRCARLPVLDSDPVSDYRGLLEGAGFRVVSYQETAGWRDRLESAYRAIVAAGSALTAEMGKMAARALLMETALTLEYQPYCGRVLIVAEKSK